MAKQTLILVVDDEATVREVVRKYLEHEGFRVAEAEAATAALAMVREQPPDLIVLDLMLPGVDGFAITRSLRSTDDSAFLSVENQIPIIILTARTNELDRIAGFELGADDYVIKPFSPRELVGRVKAVLRRSGSGKTDADEKPVALTDLSIDPRSRDVRVRGAPVELTAKEFDLLLFLAR
ncbi:MAG: response regulator transcription factor, partial [Chloroflexota bacterium]